MLVYKGKHNVAKVMIDSIDPETVKQIYSFLNHPAFENCKIVIMPDCHAGKGAVVGYTATMNNYVIPNLVGVDIGCGVLAVNLGKIEINLQELDHFIRENIPSGHSVHATPLPGLTLIRSKNYPGEFFEDQIVDVCVNISSDSDRALCSVGTLGGGNHFIELDKDPDGNIWLLIHSGSRKFGLDVAAYHQQKAEDLMREMFIGAAYKDLEFLPLEHGGNAYLKDMRFAQDYAQANRNFISGLIIEEFLKMEYPPKDRIIESIHNYIGKDNVIRKGAIKADAGELVVIPLNMRDGTIIAMGMGNTAWNCSAPHGAGRLMSRKRAKESINLEDFKQEMEGIWTSCVGKATLDEAPMAYKNMDDIVEAIKETVSIQFIMKPIYNFKAAE